MALEGIGFFTWQVQNCENGDISAIVAQAQAAHLTHVLVKIADGPQIYGYEPSTGDDRAARLVTALHDNHIQVVGWHYVYGYDPTGEANRAIQRIRQLGVDMYVIDAEKEYKQPGKSSAARKFMDQLRSALPNLPVALSSFRYPSLHPDLPWNEFLNHCDYNMPQIYWMQAHNPGAQLNRSYNEFQARPIHRPMIPTGAAFFEHNWNPTAAEVLEFLQAARKLNLPAVNFWEWSDARGTKVPGVWDTIRSFQWGIDQPVLDICEQLVNAMNAHDPGQLGNLYDPAAVQVTAARTVQGIPSILAWYNSLFTDLLPNAKFKLTGRIGGASSRQFNWTAVSPKGKVQNGNDTLGLANGKIAYHYSSFTVTQ